MEPRGEGQPGRSSVLPATLRTFARPAIALPAAVVVGMLGIAFGVQPGGGTGHAQRDPVVAATSTPLAASPTVPPSATPRTSTSATTTATRTPTPAGLEGNLIAPPEARTGEQVAGERGTPTATPTESADLAREATQCGAIQESTHAFAIEQTLGGLSVRATRVTVYPLEYFRCILLATGGRDAVALAESAGAAGRSGSTHAVLVDLWVTNPGKDFGQLNLRTASLAAAGQSFAPLATLGGRSESVVASGQGRNVTLVVAIQAGVGPTTGPMTVTIDAPLYAGKQTAGKYQIFLPTP